MKNETEQKRNNDKPSRRKYIIACSILLLFILITLYFIYSVQGEPKPDSQSETLILKEAAWQISQKEPNEISDEDYKRVREIILGKRNYVDYEQGSIVRFRDFSTSELCDIKALETLTNLESLHLDCICWPKEKIPNWMKFLAKLGAINLDEKYKIDLEPIEKLQKLKVFGILDTPVSNFESIENLTNLKSLIIYNTNVSDLEPLRNLTNLQYLDLVNIHIPTLEPLKNLSNLEFLNLHDTMISNLEPLKEIKSLRRVDIRNCPNITNEQVLDLQKALPDLEIVR